MNLCMIIIFFLFPTLWSPLVGEKNTPTSGPSYHRIKIVPSNNESVLNLSIIIIYFYTDKFFKSFTSNVECFRFILGKKSKGEGDSKSILPRAPIVERNCQSIEVWETRIEHLPRKGGGYFSDNPIACSNEL